MANPMAEAAQAPIADSTQEAYRRAGAPTPPQRSISPSAAGDQGASPEVTEVRAAYERWIEAVTSGDPDVVMDLYAEDAVLMATFSPAPRAEPQQLRDYFIHFTALPGLRASTSEAITRIYGDVATHDGLYTFTYRKDGGVAEVPARFSFIFRKGGDRWMIAGHHSSQVPQSIG